MDMNHDGMQQTDNENMENGDQGEREGTSIELMIYADGKMEVSVEKDDTENQEENVTEVQNLQQALAMIKQIADGLTSDTADQVTEDQAYQQEMAGPMGQQVS